MNDRTRAASETSADHDSPNELPLVSIVTPTLNRAELLEFTLRSVRNQTHTNIEHIVVDGGSQDGTLDLLRRMEGTYGLKWASEPDNGMYQAINRGLRMAQGSIMAYLNSDDLYLPWTVEVIVEAFRQHPQADFVFGDAVNVEESSGRIIFYFQMPFDGDFIRRSGFLCQPSVFWRRGVYEQEGPFDDSLRFVADCDYWMRAADRRTFHKIREFVAIERDHGGTIRASESSALTAELAHVRSRYVRLTGWGHQRRLAYFWLKGHWWGVLTRAVFALQYLPGRGGGGPWRRLIDSGQLKVRWGLVPLRVLPNIGGWRPRLVRANRSWLHPADGHE